MGSASNISSATAKTSNLAASLASSLSSSFSVGQMAADGLFADILSQNQPPPAPPQQQNNNTQGSQTSSSQTGPSSAQDTDANDTQNSGNSGTPVASQPVVSRTGTGTGKTSHHHDVKQAGDKSKPDNTNNQPAANAPVTVQTNAPANTSTSTDSTSAAVTAAASTTQNDANDNNNPTNNNSTTNSDPANQPVLAADLNVVSAAPIPAAPAAPQTTDPAPAANDNAGSGDPASNGDVNASQLMLMLMQLEHLTAAAHLADPTSFNANVQAAQDPNTATATAGTDNTNTKGQVDLKALLAAVTKSNSANFLGGDTSQTSGADTNQDSQNTASTNTAPAAQSTQAPANSPQTQPAPTDKWMNANFANLFNLANVDQNNNAVPLALNQLINPGATPGSGDDAAVDDGGQGQNETSSHNLAANAPLNNNLPQTAGPTQAANPYDFASQLSAMRATKGGATGLPTPVEQVMLQLSRGLSKDGSTQMSIQLRPAELGRIDVKLNVGGDGKVQGTVTADNPATLNLLLKDVRGLERALQEAGLRADSGSLQFNLRGDGQQGGSFNQTANNSSGSSGGSTSSNAQTSLPVFADQSETYYLTPGGVNMRV